MQQFRFVFFSTLLFLIPFLTFGQRYGKRYEENKLVNGKGVIEEYGSFLWGYSYNSADTSNYGKLTVITEYENNRRNGRRIQFFNYPNDTASVEHYINDTLEGPYYYNHTNGKLWTRGVYDRNTFSGTPEYWSEEGVKLNDNISYNESTRLYYLDDSVCNKKVSLYGHGGLDNQHVRDIIWFSNGKIDSVYSFRWAYWGKSSEIRRNYVDSTRTYFTYGAGTIPMSSASQRIDSINCSFHRDGQDLFFIDRDKMVMEGRYLDYHYNSTIIKLEGYYRDGVPVGEWRTYDERGNLINTVIH